MILSWFHNQRKACLECTINDDLKYIAYNGGAKIQKYYKDELVATIRKDEAWEEEKHWLSEQFGDILGKYEPIDLEEGGPQHTWKVLNKWDVRGAFPVFGITPEKEYLDRLQRPASVQTGMDMKIILRNQEQKLQIEQDKNGDYWQRLYCDEQKVFYNVQPCCVFPENPGRLKLSKQEAERLLSTVHSDKLK